MDDKPSYVCSGCEHDAGSKFALKRHKQHCVKYLGHAPGLFNRPARGANQFEQDRYALASRDTKRHRFVPNG